MAQLSLAQSKKINVLKIEVAFFLSTKEDAPIIKSPTNVEFNLGINVGGIDDAQR